MSKNNYFYLSLGHRCYTAIYLIERGLRTVAYPFDHIISKFDGIIDCFENDFENFFPKEIKVTEYPTPSGGKGKFYASKNFHVNHHDLSDPTVINKFKERIQRLDNKLKECENNNVKTVFMRTVLCHTDYLKADRFINAIKNKYPRLEFKIIFINDVKAQERKIFKVNNQVMFAHSSSNPNQGPRNKNVIDFTESNDIFDPEVWNSLPQLPKRINTGNDEFKAKVSFSRLNPFDPNN